MATGSSGFHPVDRQERVFHFAPPARPPAVSAPSISDRLCLAIFKCMPDSVMSSNDAHSTQRVTRWVTRLVPLFLVGCTGFSTYVVIARVCFGYFQGKGWATSATVVIVLLSINLVLMTASYARTYMTIRKDAGLVPLGEKADARFRAASVVSQGMEHDPHELEDPRELGCVTARQMRDLDPDSPGLEVFYSTDAFVCDHDGYPRWCAHCATWKPDRSHHSAEIGRCVKRMDHFCPWVGGMVAEPSFKFFLLFNLYATFFCAVCLASSATTMAMQVSETLSVDPQVCIVAGLSALLGLFAFSMTALGFQFSVRNLTNVDAINHRHRSYRLAIRIPRPGDECIEGAAAGALDQQHRLLRQSGRGVPLLPVIRYPLDKIDPEVNRPFGPAEHEWHEEEDGGQDEQSEAGEEEEEEEEEDPEAAEALERQLRALQPHREWEAEAAPGYCPAAAARRAAERLRNSRARRYFAVVYTRPGENPWDRGALENWKSVMGNGGVLDWFLPVRGSPCAGEFSSAGYYRFGPLIQTLRARHGLRVPVDVVEKDADV